MKHVLTRREALRRLTVVSASLATGLVVACSSKPNCSDTTGLSAEELKAREAAAYTDQSMDASATCDACAHWAAPASSDACGGCKVLRGPVQPKGGCKLFAARAG